MMSSSPNGFETLCTEILDSIGPVTDSARQVIVEDLRLRHLYPNQHVAFIDAWDVIAGTRTLTRTVLAHGAEPEELQDAIDGCAADEWPRVTVDFFAALDDDLEVPVAIEER